jgi:Tol biopolymer transport system component/type 1 fimbria pilin
MSEHSDRIRLMFRAFCLGLVAACGGDNPLGNHPPTTGMSTILITLFTTGSLPDPNGYRVVLDQSISHLVTASESASLSLTVAPGNHRVELTDVADHCVVTGGTVRSIATSAFGTTGVSFRVNCPRLATLRIRTSTSGTSLDTDGYLLTIDGASKGTLGTRDSVVFDDLQPSFYRVRLSAVVGNCSVSGGSSRQIVLGDGGLETIDFAISCVPRIDDLPGETLVVSVRSVQDDDFNLYLLRGEGTLRQRLTDNVGDEGIPEFSPTGDRIVFLQMTASGRSLRMLDRVTRQESPFPGQGADRAVWSPDGARIAFTRGGRIYRINRDGTGEVPLTANFDDRDPYWSPDGTRIAFTRNSAAYIINADGTGLRQVSVDQRLAGPWSPDGRFLVLTALVETCSSYYYYCYYYGGTLTPSEIQILELGTGKALVLTNTPTVAKWSPAWSADGQRLYFISAESGNPDIYRVFLAGGTPTNLTNSQEQENWVSVGTVPPGGVSVSLAGTPRR